jgi:NosR/NirI family nitrous oxide reductase transcriptional regulator
MHTIRLALVVAVVLLIRLNAQSQRAGGNGRLSENVTVGRVRQSLPSANSIAVTSNSNSGFCVTDTEGKTVGHVLQTSPQSDHIIGFSGPTNVLIVQDVDGRVRGIEVLNSGDTREHVRQVINDPGFFPAFVGADNRQLQTLSVDAVSGATLTSLAIAESVRNRVGGEVISLRFRDPLSVADCQALFPTAARLDEYNTVFDTHGPLGTVQRTSPAADNTIGYQGPTDVLVGFDTDGKVIGITLRRTFDNEDYVTYVRDDDYFLSLFNDRTLQQLAELDLEAAQIEGVSGATMTSLSIANGIVLAAAKQLQTNARAGDEKKYAPGATSVLNANAVGTGLTILMGIAICFTRRRSQRWVRIPFQLFLVVYLGFVNGGLISQAMFVGWSKNGIPWLAAAGLVMLSVTALVLPATTGRNTYCTHICPHGAAQQLLKNRFQRRRLGKSVRQWLKLIPFILLSVVVLVALSETNISLVDLEAFDAYVPTIAGVIPVAIAVAGLMASLFVPMAYCRFGCPTGSLLEFLRFNRRSNQPGRRDVGATFLLLLSLLLYSLGN